MASDWENIFQGWASPPSETEQIKCDNALGVIRNAIKASNSLQNRDVRVFAQGSYRNRTNVRADSDIDICVLCSDSYFYDLPKGMTSVDFGITPATYQYNQYKNDVEEALINYLGGSAVSRGNKAFDVHENTYRVDADVVPCFEYRLYQKNHNYLQGTSFMTDKGQFIFNFPEQNYENGVSKNDATGRQYKGLVRVIKCLRNLMSDNGYTAANKIPSYLIECLLWNVPNNLFSHATYTEDAKSILAHLYCDTETNDRCEQWVEVNCIKYLFHATQPWTYQQVNEFALSAFGITMV